MLPRERTIALIVCVLVACLGGCEFHWKNIRAGFVDGPSALTPTDAVEKALTEYIAFHVELHEKERVYEQLAKDPTRVPQNLDHVMLSLGEEVVRLPQPWRWPEMMEDILGVLQTPDRWQFEPVEGEETFEGVVYRERGVPEPQRNVVVTLTPAEMVRLTELALEKRWLDAFADRVEDYGYSDVESAGNYIREALLKDIFISSVPGDVGDPMLPALIKALRVHYLRRHAVQGLQIISGLSFGYPPESLLDPGNLIFKVRQKRAIARWEKWWEDRQAAHVEP